MKILLVIGIVLPLAGQQVDKPAVQSAAPAAVPASAPAPAPATAAPSATPAQSPTPAEENWLTGYIELGYQGQTGVGGSLATYRSIVDLGSGPKLIGAEFSVLDPKKRLFDRIDVRASNWGGDPYATLHVDARKAGLYRFDADYRSLVYYNNLPSFADPQLAAKGIALNEQSFDTRRHLGSYTLELFPAKRITPYFSFERDSESGNGVSSFSNTYVNEYAVPDTTSDRTSLYRGGLRIELPRMHLTLEEGGTTYREDQNVYVSPGANNPGDTTSTYLGQPLYLTSLLQAYGIRGRSIYTKALFSANPYSWLDLSGQFLFSQASNTVNYQQSDNGEFAVLGQALLVTSEQYLVAAAAKLPHTTAGLGAEVRPFARIRILESWMTDRLHNAGSGTVSTAPLSMLASTLANNYNQQETNVFFDVNKKLMLRGGYRYVWGDGENLVIPLAGLFTTERGTLRRNVGLAGVVYHPSQKLSVHGDIEGARSTGTYFRTSLYNYWKLRAQARYQLLSTISASLDTSLLRNTNPLAGASYQYGVTQEALSIQWLPAHIKALSLQGTYERSAVHSNISYLIPQTLGTTSSIYRENDNSLTALVGATLPLAGAKISVGGSALLASGTRPTNYYQPVAKITMPLGHHMAGFAEWRYYGFGESFYSYESFRTHLIIAGLRFSR
jgi:hypothetical protein